ALKRNVPTNVWTSCYWYYGAAVNNAMANEVLRVFTAAGDPYPHGFALAGHTPVMAYAAAIKAAGSTETDKVIAALECLEFDMLSGRARFRKEDHQLIYRSFVVNWEPTEAEPGWKAREFATIEDVGIVTPPAPGTKWEP